MKHELNFFHLACQTCQAKIHCEQCGEELTQSLLKFDGIHAVQIDMVAKSATVDAEIGEEKIEAYLEDIGLFLN